MHKNTITELKTVQETYKQMVLEKGPKEYSLKGWSDDEIDGLDSELWDKGHMGPRKGQNTVTITGPKGNKVMTVTNKRSEKDIAKIMKMIKKAK